MICAGVLLTGGASRRMGTDKATLVVQGESLAVRAARVLAAVCDPVIEVGPGVTDLPSVREDPPGAGPLAAFVAGADALAVAGPIVVLACDLPFVDEAVLRELVDHSSAASVVPVVGRAQLACARWSPAAIEAGRHALARGDRALQALLEADDAVFVDAEAHARALADVDTPDDLRRLGLT